MITAGNLKMPASVGVNACLYILDPGAVHAQGYFVFALAGSGAGVATDTLAIVDDEAVIHKFLLPKKVARMRFIWLSTDD
jgi:hypothetical protein